MTSLHRLHSHSVHAGTQIHLNGSTKMQDLLTHECYRIFKPNGPRNRSLRILTKNSRTNQVYPDLFHTQKGIEQALPLKIDTPFKWLMNEPFYPEIGKRKEYLFFHTQQEGGCDWLGAEIECRDLFILLKQDKKGLYHEISHHLLYPFDGQYVYRIEELEVSYPNMLQAKVRKGSYQNQHIEQIKFEITPHEIKKYEQIVTKNIKGT